MKKMLSVVIVLLVVSAGGFAGYRNGWFVRHAAEKTSRPGSSGTPAVNEGSSAAAPAAATTGAPAAAAGGQADAKGGTSDASPLVAPAAYNDFVDLASADFGGRIENAGSGWAVKTHGLIDANPEAFWWQAWDTNDVVHWVISFYHREPAVVAGVVFNQPAPETEYGPPENRQYWAKDVEVWVAMDDPPGGVDESSLPKGSALPGFAKVAAGTLRPEYGDQKVTFAPVAARFIAIRILSNQSGGIYVSLGKIKVMEGQRAGYVPLLSRHPELAALKNGTVPWAEAARAALAASPAAASALTAPALDACAAVSSDVKTPPRHPESREVLVVSPTDGYYRPADWARRKPDDDWKAAAQGIDLGIYDRIHPAFVPVQLARPAMLAAVDTVALVGMCDDSWQSLPASFKRVLASWVAAGHKLIIQDSDWCGGGSADYYGSFLPYPFATSNPGAQGARGERLLFVEENTLGNSKRADPAFLDLEAWVESTRGSNNELGDSNTIVKYDAHWCGHLFGTNMLKKNGFMEAYAHHGRGLIIYNGFDLKEDQGRDIRQLITRELAQPFDPDGLPCSARLADFVITTEHRLRTQALVPGKRYEYPLTILSNQGYSGRVTLTGVAGPGATGVGFNFAPPAIDLTEIGNATLSVSTTAGTPVRDHAIAVRGTDAAGKTNTLCLYLGPPRSGTLQVVSALPRPSKPTKNLEIILDASGSMKTPLGKSTRMATAREVLRTVVARLPEDFNVGLRFYGHRYGSRQKETCTDTELVRSIEKIDRTDLAAKVDTVQPRGETPLIYSLLQTPADLKEVGGGSVILVTDGEESCGGDPVAAAEQLKGSGVDVTLNIVGFTLKGKAVEQQLSKLAESTGGRYYSAQSGEALGQALLIAAIDRIQYRVFDATGKQVAAGEAGDRGEELPPGEYRVVAEAGEQQLVAEKVAVAAGADVVLKVVVKDSRLALGR